MSTGLNESLVTEVYSKIVPLIGDFELWCHRTRETEVGTFWGGLHVPAIQAGLRSTATLLTDLDEFPSLDDAIAEFTDRCIPEDPTNNTRVFVIAPTEHKELLVPFDSGVPFKQMGLLPGRFVVAHLSLLDPQLHMNPDFSPDDL